MTTNEELRKLAEAATQGPWYGYGRYVHDADICAEKSTVLAKMYASDKAHETAAYIAAVSPDVVLGLLDSLDAARAEVAELHQNQERNLQTLEGNRSTIDQLRAEVERHKVTLRTMSEWSDKLEARIAELEKPSKDLNELAKVWALSYASPHHITFTLGGLRNLIVDYAAPTPQAQRLTDADIEVLWKKCEEAFLPHTLGKFCRAVETAFAKKNGINLGE